MTINTRLWLQILPVWCGDFESYHWITLGRWRNDSYRCNLISSTPESRNGGLETNMLYLTTFFGGSKLFLYFCRRICNVTNGVLSHKVGMRYVSTRKRQLDKLPLGRFWGVTPSGESIPQTRVALWHVEFVGLWQQALKLDVDRYQKSDLPLSNLLNKYCSYIVILGGKKVIKHGE